jgi:predicted lipid-binding transport protein (Tim44 family)
MNDIIRQVADATGIEPDVAEKALGLMLGFLEKEGDDAAVQTMLAAIPGAKDLVSQYAGDGSGGLLSGLMGGGIMGLGQQLMGAGLGMGEITTLAKQTISVAKQYAGEEVVDRVVASIPGLSQFV